MEHYYAMILAGGGGTRLWPMSRQKMPKQLLPLTGDKTMLRVSVERLHPLFEPNQIYIVTGRQYVEAMRAELPEIPAENFVIEPYGRDNAAAVALGLAVIHKRDRMATVAMLTADHHIAKREKFREVLRVAHKNRTKTIAIVTLGDFRQPSPATSFGVYPARAQNRGHRRVHDLRDARLQRKAQCRDGHTLLGIGELHMELRHVHLENGQSHDRIPAPTTHHVHAH